MGTWGTGAFDNDLAADMAANLDEEGISVVQAALTFRSAPDQLDAICAAEVVAAAEIVAAFLGRPADDIPDEVVEWIAANELAESEITFLQALSSRLIELVIREDCELFMLWRKNQVDFATWLGRIDNLRMRLR
jgi:hypothetical protein